MLEFLKRQKKPVSNASTVPVSASAPAPAASRGVPATGAIGSFPRPREVIVFGAEMDQETILARELLTQRGTAHRYIDVTHDETVRYELRKKTGSRDLPQIFLDEIPIGDFQALRQIEYRGDLDRLLAGQLDPRALANPVEDERGDLSGRDAETLRRRLRDGDILSLTFTSGGGFDVWAEIYGNPPQVYYEGTPRPIEELERIVGEIVGLVEGGQARFAWADED
jgi:glutaredoxin 3